MGWSGGLGRNDGNFSIVPSTWRLRLGVLHYYMLVKSDVRQPLAFAAVLVVLLGARFGRHYFDLLRIAKNSTKRPTDNRAVVSTSSVAAGSAGTTQPGKQWKGELKVAAIFRRRRRSRPFG